MMSRPGPINASVITNGGYPVTSRYFIAVFDNINKITFFHPKPDLDHLLRPTEKMLRGFKFFLPGRRSTTIQFRPFQMSMRIDQAGRQNHITQIKVFLFLAENQRSRANVLDPGILDHHGPVFNNRGWINNKIFSS